MSAETVLVGGRVTTGLPALDDGLPTALAIEAGRVRLAGSDDAVRALAGPSTSVVELGGRRVVPGLIDSHLHAVRAGLTWTARVDWSGAPTLAAALELVSEAAAGRPEGDWVAVVGGWHPGQFAERRGPTSAELTEAAPRHPVYVQLLYESAVLNAATVTALGGGPAVVSDRDGFRRCLALMGAPPFAEQVASTEVFLRRLSAVGITGVIDPGGGNLGADAYRAVMELWRLGPLPVRLRLYVSNSGVAAGQEPAQTREYVRHLHPGFGDEYLRYVGLGEKLVNAYGDGEGLTQAPVTAAAAVALDDVTRVLLEAGWPAHVHAIRDETIGAILDVWEAVDRVIPLAGRRFSLAHADGVGERNLRRLARLGVGVAVQDRLVFRAADTLRAWGLPPSAPFGAPPLRRMLELGIPVGGGTDGTVVSPYDPWRSIWWLVTGRSVDGAPPRSEAQRLTRAEALRAYTAGSAWFSFDDDSRGTLAPGMQADLAVLSDDYFAVPEDDIPGLRSVLTLVGGRVVHSTL